MGDVNFNHPQSPTSLTLTSKKAEGGPLGTLQLATSSWNIKRDLIIPIIGFFTVLAVFCFTVIAVLFFTVLAVIYYTVFTIPYFYNHWCSLPIKWAPTSCIPFTVIAVFYFTVFTTLYFYSHLCLLPIEWAHTSLL